jgi:hypothetical protein
MGWLDKLIVVDNLEYPKYKRNSAEILIEFFTKKKRKKKCYPQIKSTCCDLLALIKLNSRDRYSFIVIFVVF